MNEQQQKLYDKLLKKVNEYCLGAAAEDVIAAIDALVETYEDQLDIRYVFIGSRACGKSEEFNRRGRVVNKLKALEILKKYIKIEETGDDLFPYSIKEDQYASLRSGKIISQIEYEFLKEVLK